MPKTSHMYTPPFCDGMPKGNHKPSSKGGGDEELRNRAKSARNPLISSRMPPKSVIEPPEWSRHDPTYVECLNHPK